MTDEKLGPFSQTLLGHALQLIKFKERTTEAENTISVVEHNSEQVESLVQALEKQIQSMSDHIDDLENKGRRKKCTGYWLSRRRRVGSQPTKFFENWIPDLLGLETKVGLMKIERAHCTLAPKPGPNQRP